MKKFRRITVSFLALLTLLSVAHLGTVSVSAQAKVPTGPVAIGIMGPFTGPAASIGTEQLNWSKQAVEDFNKASGWSVDLVQGDTQLDASKAVDVADSMIVNKDIYGVVGPSGSQEVEATGSKFKTARLVTITPSATRPSLTTNGWDTLFRVVPTDDVQGPTDANYLAKQLKITKLFVIDDQTSYSTGLADVVVKDFTAAGGTVVDRESVTQKDVDFSALATKIKTTGAEAVFFPGQIASQGALLAKQLKEQSVKVTFFAADGFFSPDDFIKGAAGATEGAYISVFAPDISGLASSADVVKRYTDKYGSFGTFGPPTYAATTVLLEAMKRAFEGGTLTREAVRGEVAKTNQKLSVLGGPLSFDKNGDVANAQFYIFLVKDGKFTLVPSSSAMTATMAATMAATQAK